MNTCQNCWLKYPQSLFNVIFFLLILTKFFALINWSTWIMITFWILFYSLHGSKSANLKCICMNWIFLNYICLSITKLNHTKFFLPFFSPTIYHDHDYFSPHFAQYKELPKRIVSIVNPHGRFSDPYIWEGVIFWFCFFFIWVSATKCFERPRTFRYGLSTDFWSKWRKTTAGRRGVYSI